MVRILRDFIETNKEREWVIDDDRIRKKTISLYGP